MNRRTLLSAGAAVAAALPLAARAQESAIQADGTLNAEKAPVILGGTFAKLTSQVALERSSNDVVRQFAELEVEEQTAVAQSFGVPADAAPQVTAEQAAQIEALQAADDAAFDAAYIDGQITGHEELRQLAATYAANGSDPQARGGALVAVSHIDTHLVMLASIRATLA